MTTAMTTDGSDGVDIRSNLMAVNAAIAAATAKAGREAADVALVAVSKTHGAERIREALDAGHRLFGENRVQEAEAKWPELRELYPDLRLHLIGPLQRNKVRRAVALFDVIQSVDRPELARALANAFEASGVARDVLIEVNTGEEPQKNGVLPADVDRFVRACVDDYRLPVRGLMCVPPLDEEPSLHFALLNQMARRNGLDVLSMGMSADFAVAIAFGATLVRVGTAIFGSRPAPG
jgi:PLP dependent protein